MNELVLKLTTVGATGACTVKSAAVTGKLYALLYIPKSIDTGAGIVVTCEGMEGTSKPLLTKTSLGTAALWFYPRDLEHKVEDGAALTGTTGGDRTEPVLGGNIQAVIASGGGTSVTGYLVVYYCEY